MALASPSMVPHNYSQQPGKRGLFGKLFGGAKGSAPPPAAALAAAANSGPSTGPRGIPLKSGAGSRRVSGSAVSATSEFELAGGVSAAGSAAGSAANSRRPSAGGDGGVGTGRFLFNQHNQAGGSRTPSRSRRSGAGGTGASGYGYGASEYGARSHYADTAIDEGDEDGDSDFESDGDGEAEFDDEDLEQIEQSVTCMALHPSAPILAVGCSPDIIKLWNLATQRFVSGIRHSGRLTALAWSTDGKHLCSAASWECPAAGWTHSLRIWVVHEKTHAIAPASQLIGQEDLELPDESFPNIPRLSGNAIRLALQKAMAEADRDGVTLNAAVARGDVAGGVMDGKATTEDLLSNQGVPALQQLHQDPVSSLVFQPLDDNACIRLLDEHGVTGTVVVASGSADRTVRLWCYDRQGDVTVHVLRQHRAEVTSVAFSPDGNMLMSGSADGTVICWRVVLEPVYELPRGDADGDEGGEGGGGGDGGDNDDPAADRGRIVSCVPVVTQNVTFTCTFDPSPALALEPVHTLAFFPSFSTFGRNREYTVAVGTAHSLVLLRVHDLRVHESPLTSMPSFLLTVRKFERHTRRLHVDKAAQLARALEEEELDRARDDDKKTPNATKFGAKHGGHYGGGHGQKHSARSKNLGLRSNFIRLSMLHRQAVDGDRYGAIRSLAVGIHEVERSVCLLAFALALSFIRPPTGLRARSARTSIRRAFLCVFSCAFVWSVCVRGVMWFVFPSLSLCSFSLPSHMAYDLEDALDARHLSRRLLSVSERQVRVLVTNHEKHGHTLAWVLNEDVDPRTTLPLISAHFCVLGLQNVPVSDGTDAYGRPMAHVPVGAAAAACNDEAARYNFEGNYCEQVVLPSVALRRKFDRFGMQREGSAQLSVYMLNAHKGATDGDDLVATAASDTGTGIRAMKFNLEASVDFPGDIEPTISSRDAFQALQLQVRHQAKGANMRGVLAGLDGLIASGGPRGPLGNANPLFVGKLAHGHEIEFDLPAFVTVMSARGVPPNEAKRLEEYQRVMGVTVFKYPEPRALFAEAAPAAALLDPAEKARIAARDALAKKKMLSTVDTSGFATAETGSDGDEDGAGDSVTKVSRSSSSGGGAAKLAAVGAMLRRGGRGRGRGKAGADGDDGDDDEDSSSRQTADPGLASSKHLEGIETGGGAAGAAGEDATSAGGGGGGGGGGVGQRAHNRASSRVMYEKGSEAGALAALAAAQQRKFSSTSDSDAHEPGYGDDSSDGDVVQWQGAGKKYSRSTSSQPEGGGGGGSSSSSRLAQFKTLAAPVLAPKKVQQGSLFGVGGGDGKGLGLAGKIGIGGGGGSGSGNAAAEGADGDAEGTVKDARGQCATPNDCAVQ